MKRNKIILASLGMLFVVGTALAFKAKPVLDATLYYRNGVNYFLTDKFTDVNTNPSTTAPYTLYKKTSATGYSIYAIPGATVYTTSVQ